MRQPDGRWAWLAAHKIELVRDLLEEFFIFFITWLSRVPHTRHFAVAVGITSFESVKDQS